MELFTTLTTIFALAGLAVGYFMVFAQCKKGGSGYFIVACFCVILSATYAWKAYAAVVEPQHLVEELRVPGSSDHRFR
jgi:glucose dehydrogenase